MNLLARAANLDGFSCPTSCSGGDDSCGRSAFCTATDSALLALWRNRTESRFDVFTTRNWPKLGAVAWLAASISLGAEAREARTRSWDVIGGREPGKPVVAVVGLREQKITVYDSAGPILHAPISSGRRGYETPAGIFTLLQKNRDHVSNLYEDAEMPFMQRLTWSGVALHAGPLPGYRASHGCIRLPYGFAQRLFDLTSVGTRVIIAPTQTGARPISHPLLDRLQAAGVSATSVAALEDVRLAAEAASGKADAAMQRAREAAAVVRRAEATKTRALKLLAVAMRGAEAQKTGPRVTRAQAHLERARAEATAKIAALLEATKLRQAAETERIAAERLGRETRLKAWPLSILVSLKAQRIYVRQGFEPILDLPAPIKDPGRRIGTHAFYATERVGATRGWVGVSLNGSERATEAAQALDRVEVPDGVIALLGAGAWLGSTLIITDEPPYKETGPGTDFLVVLSMEPQGALKIRTQDDAGQMAGLPGPKKQRVRAYRAASDDSHFRHPLGGFMP